MKICVVENCDKKHRSNGFCDVHYDRERRKGGSLSPYSEEHLLAEKRRAFLRCVRDAGWTEERFIILNYAQGGLCYICNNVSYQKGHPMRLCMDHNHETNIPRGLICQTCNAALWLYEDLDRVKAIERYLGRGRCLDGFIY